MRLYNPNCCTATQREHDDRVWPVEGVQAVVCPCGQRWYRTRHGWREEDMADVRAELASARAAATVLRTERDEARAALQAERDRPMTRGEYFDLLDDTHKWNALEAERDQARRDLEQALKEQARLRQSVDALLAMIGELASEGC